MNTVPLLQQLPMFALVDPKHLRQLAVEAPPVEFQEGATIFQQGAQADVALLLVHGQLVASVASGTATREVGTIAPGEVVGEQALLASGGVRSANVTASTASVCLLLTNQILHATPNPATVAIENKLVDSLCARIRRTNASMREAWGMQQVAEKEEHEDHPTLRGRIRHLFGAD